MTPVKANFSSMFDNINCNNCIMNIPESDSHLLECTKMIEVCISLYNDCEAEYLDIFGDMDSQICVTKIYEDIFQAKTKLEVSK